jgi:hypothetical protein
MTKLLLNPSEKEEGCNLPGAIFLHIKWGCPKWPKKGIGLTNVVFVYKPKQLGEVQIAALCEVFERFPYHFSR